MLHKVGCEVIYRDGAFKTPSDHKRSQLWNPLPEQLLGALELAKKVVLDQSQAEWIVVIKSCIKTGFRADDIMAKLVVYIPADADQEAELLEALASFEEVIEERLGLPVDTAYRSIEENRHACVVCGGNATQLREEVREDGLSDPTYFCEQHEHKLSDRDFIGHGPAYSWLRL